MKGMKNMKYFNSDGSKIKDLVIEALSADEYMRFLKENHTINQKKWKRNIVTKKRSMIDGFVENPNADNRLYYFRFIFKGLKYYKIGITSQTLEKRYSTDYAKIDKILYDKKIDGAIKIESEIKEKFKDAIFPLAYLNGGGHTETFDKDVLGLDD